MTTPTSQLSLLPRTSRPEVLAKLLQVAEGLVSRLPAEITAKYQFVRNTILTSEIGTHTEHTTLNDLTWRAPSGLADVTVNSQGEETRTTLLQALFLLNQLQQELDHANAEHRQVLCTFEDLLPLKSDMDITLDTKPASISDVLTRIELLHRTVQRYIRTVNAALASASEVTNYTRVRELMSENEKLKIKLKKEQDERSIEHMKLQKGYELERHTLQGTISRMEAELNDLRQEVDDASVQTARAHQNSDALHHEFSSLQTRCNRLEMAREDYRSRCNSLKEKLHRHTALLVQQLKSEHASHCQNMQLQHQAAIEKLSLEHRLQKETLQQTLDSRERELQMKLKDTVLSLERQHRQAIEAQEQSHSARCEELYLQHMEDLQVTKNTHAEEIRLISDSHRAECLAISERYRKEMTDLRANLNAHIEEKDRAQRDAIDHLQAEFLRHEKELLDSHAQELASQSEKYRVQRDAWQKERDSDRQEQERVCLKWADRIQEQARKHELELSQLTQSKDDEISELKQSCRLLEQRIPDNFDLASVFQTMDELVSEHRSLQQTNKILKKQNRQISRALSVQDKFKSRTRSHHDGENVDPRLLHDSAHIALKAQREFVSAHEQLQRTLTVVKE